jgi:hypothetical protein
MKALLPNNLLSVTFAIGLSSPLLAQSPSKPAANAPTPAQQSAAFYQQCQAAEIAGDPTAAKTAYLNALKADPKNANARFSLGQLKLNAGTIAAKGREAKFGEVMVPAFQIEGASLQEALEALAVLVEKESKKSVTPNFVMDDPKQALADTKLSLNLKNMPARAVLKYLIEQSNAKVRYDEHAIVVSAR